MPAPHPAPVERELDALRARVAALEAAVARSEVGGRHVDPSVTFPRPAPVDRGHPAARGPARESRRWVLAGAAAATAAATAAVATTAPEPAGATLGTMSYGGTNDAGADMTTLVSSSPLATLRLQNRGALGSALSVVGASSSQAPAAHFDGDDSTAIFARSDLYGAFLYSRMGEAVRGETSGGVAGRFVGLDAGTGVVVSANRTQLRLDPRSAVRQAPHLDTFSYDRGSLVRDSAGDLWLCVATGTPGSWRKLAGPSSAGSLHVVPAPVRIYDSRAGTNPAVGAKSPLSPNVARTIDTKAAGSGVPAGAIAVLLTCLVVDAPEGPGNLVVWANGVARPFASSMVWGGTGGRASSTVVTAVDTQARLQVASNLATNLALDVVGYYR